MRSGIASFGAALLLLAGCAGSVDETLENDSFDGNESDPLAQEAPSADPVDSDTPTEPATPTAPTDPTSPAPSGGPQPKVPAISGTCPEFRTGTATIGGLSGISLQVGAKKNGTGSIVFYWHGTGSNSGESRLFAGTSEVLAQGGIVVSPSRSLGSGGDCSGTGTFSKDDMKVADLIYACAVKNHNIDPRRVYTTGCSAGGLQAGCFATLRSSYVAAAVPNSGGIVAPQTIQDRTNIPALMTMHGGSSDQVIVRFSQTSATLDNQFARAGGYVMNCNHGGGHCQAPGPLQQAAWTFMKAHPFGAKPYAGQAGTPAGYPSYCKPIAGTGATAAPTGTAVARPRG